MAKKIISFLFVFFFLIYFLKSDLISKESESERDEKSKSKTKLILAPAVTLPLFKLTDSTEENVQAQAQVLTSAGGGITFQIIREKTEEGTKVQKKFPLSFSVLALFSGNLLGGNSYLDPSLAVTINLSLGGNNEIVVGYGHDFGLITGRNYRGFFLLGFSQVLRKSEN